MQNAKEAISMCIGTLIPSLFPSLIVTSALSQTGIPPAIRKMLFFPVHFLTGAPFSAAECFLLGQTAGYPAGIKTAAAAYEKESLSQAQAEQSALINVNPGLPFSILIAGKAFSGNSATGAVLYSAVFLSDLLLGIILRRSKNDACKPVQNRDTHFTASDILVKSVSEAAAATLNICAWILAFFIFTAPLSLLPQLSPLTYVLEVTKATEFCVVNNKYPQAAFCMGFGGLCIFFQQIPDLRRLKIPLLRYLLSRLFCGLLSFLLVLLLRTVFPHAIPVFQSHDPAVRFTKGSYSGGAAILLFSIAFIISIAPKSTNDVKKHVSR